ncbi:unnamed protein product [Thelazia callipaeda]|uniref:Ubiquinol-cytochrome-c reductase complex assembly factor 2 n=1 Tax=Thelazia callipaeda TaxID=103827 RepID=A0A0N5CN30_THECL|nr:unnamed protein product [Thelazia callipaeda]
MAASRFYKRFLRLANCWPLEHEVSRPVERNASVFLKNEIERIFRKERNPFNDDLCERRLRSLEQLVSNIHLQNLPCKYKAGAMALPLKQLRKINSTQGRFVLGLESNLTQGDENEKTFIDKLYLKMKARAQRKELLKSSALEFFELDNSISPLHSKKLANQKIVSS